VSGSQHVLELGVGTGKNDSYYPPGVDVTAIDISEKMLAHARRRAERQQSRVTLMVGDAQALSFGDASFDTVVSTFVFCSVPDPIAGLEEAGRVLVPGGRLLLLEHVLSEKRVLRQMMRLLDPVTVRIWGAHINRDTVENVRAAGFEDIQAKNLSLDVVRAISARAPGSSPGPSQPG
jgi:ubiquinone/menaquinone biosynthesis C-methylase UbiE